MLIVFLINQLVVWNLKCQKIVKNDPRYFSKARYSLAGVEKGDQKAVD